MTGTEAYIVAATPTPVGRRNGGLATAHPADLAAHVLVEVLSRAAVDADAVDDVIMGCVDQAGAQASNIARVAVLSAGLPHAVPATTIDRQCGSSQQAVHFAAQAIMSGSQDILVAGRLAAGPRGRLGPASRTGHLGCTRPHQPRTPRR